MNKGVLSSFLDEFNQIVTLIHKNQMRYYDNCGEFYLIDCHLNIVETLKVTQIIEESSSIKFILELQSKIELNKDYYISTNNFTSSLILLGSITRTDTFEKMYYYCNNDLGAVYHKDKTVFKVWSPVSKEMYLELTDKNGLITELSMNYKKTGIYELEVRGNLELCKYRYKNRINLDFHYCTDPYCISNTIDKKYSYILDESKFYSFKYDYPLFSGNYNDMIIYESSVRDLTSFYLKSTFKAIIEENKIENIKNLGVTHVQFMPLNKFFGVNPMDTFKQYNWGYNPENYNEVEISYSSNTNNPYGAINELRELIDLFFKENISINLDVVFNHVYDLESFSYQTLVPGYFYCYDEYKFRTDFSYCGNDLNIKKNMVKKMILDSLLYWMRTFRICGFRFDLMGLLDIDSMNYFASNILSKYENAVIYGEGWNMKSLLKNSEKASLNNSEKMPNIAFFNDFYRDNIRSRDKTNKGFIDGKNYNLEHVYKCLLGSTNLFKNNCQSINYLECHDNYTLFDQLKVNKIKDDKIYDLHILGTSIVLISLGIPFLNCGQEFFRTKFLVENSYNFLDNINKIDYGKREEYSWYVQLVTDLIEIRKEYEVFRKKDSFHVEILNKGNLNNIALKFRGIGYNIYCIIKNNYDLSNYDFKKSVKCIFNGRSRENLMVRNALFNKPGVYIYKEEVA